MLFCSREFLVFFAAVFAVYWLLPWHRARVWLLLAASFAFYATWNLSLAWLVCGTATADYLIARALDACRPPRLRKLLLTLSIGTNLGVLGYFKYANFFLGSLEQLLHSLGASAALPTLKLIVPFGISFYTFEAISYTVDVYRRKVPAERNLANFLVFILFFPHLIAGPIVRARDFLPQVRRRKRFNWLRVQAGLQLCLLGLFKKLAIADRMALFADPVFAHPGDFRTTALWVGLIAYLVQIYCDFSGYSDLAMGTAHLLGYRLCWNFNLPYLAPNIAEFWGRWHMSLSGWLRDYVFFPLGGSRGGGWRTSFNLVVVFTLCGLWHGAAWPFIVFGLTHGIWLSLHRLFRAFCEARPVLKGLLDSVPGTALRIGVTLFLFTCTLAIYRATTLAEGMTLLHRLFVPHTGDRLLLKPLSFVLLTILLAVGHLLAHRERWRRLLGVMPAPVRGFSYAVAVSVALLLAPDAGTAFLYFQF
jgi:alginate O-acetyltransferase complex protein AlgI